MNARRRAISETNAFLTWHMQNDAPVPRIPRRRVDRGGFSQLLSRPNAAGFIAAWWTKTLERITDR